MSQDFAKKNKNYPKVTAANKKVQKEKSKGSSKNILIFFFTFSIIITCCLVIYIQNGMTYKLEIAKNNKDSSVSPKFEFYKILPNMQVKLVEDKQKLKENVAAKKQLEKPTSHNEAKISLNNGVKIQDLNPPNLNSPNLNQPMVKKELQEKKETKDNKKPLVANKKEYFLQLASFKDYKDADNLRAKLILSGIDVDIFKAKLDNGAVWYRVKSKKTQNYQEVDKLKNKLLAFRVKAIILKDIG